MAIRPFRQSVSALSRGAQLAAGIVGSNVAGAGAAGVWRPKAAAVRNESAMILMVDSSESDCVAAQPRQELGAFERPIEQGAFIRRRSGALDEEHEHCLEASSKGFTIYPIGRVCFTLSKIILSE
jgi:hypothetical protein